MNILVIGNCGVGKTWAMLRLIDRFDVFMPKKFGLIHYRSNPLLKVNIVGKYDGSMFAGSDRLSMAVMRDVDGFVEKNSGFVNIFEGDRFTNSKFVNKVNPYIIKIDGSGEAGRSLRGSNQTGRHIKSISTRVGNMRHDVVLPDSATAVEEISRIIKEKL